MKHLIIHKSGRVDTIFIKSATQIKVIDHVEDSNDDPQQ